MLEKYKTMLFIFLAFLAVLSGCTGKLTKQEENRSADPLSTAEKAETSGPKLWHYQLQNIDPAQLASVAYEIAVLEPMADGEEETRIRKKQIEQIKANGTTVLAYFSIGEASSYLPYWKPEWGAEKEGVLSIAADAPEWLGRVPNPEWPESVKVRFWQEEWWEILKPELEKIKKAGFNGVYLDIVDAYYYWGNDAAYSKEWHLGTDPKSEEEAAKRMMELVKRISAYMKEDEPGFQVFPQNAESILEFDDGSYLAAIDGIGTEDLWYDETKKSSDTKERLPYLRKIRDAGKKVLSVDYVLTDSPDQEDETRLNDYRQRCINESFFCFAAGIDRELDEWIPQR